MLEIRDVAVVFDGLEALSGVDLTVDTGEVVGVMGPSGSGKSTLLRVVAGLQRPDRGGVHWEGRSLAGVPPHERGFGLMFQDYALFPHRDVAGNVGFGLEVTGHARSEIVERVGEVLELVGMEGMANRPVDELSGGEQQRVALARALAPKPDVLMLDEPIGSLDRTLRDHLIAEFRGLFQRLALTVLYVTHDQEEAFAIAPRIVVMSGGRIVRDAAPEAIWHDPRTDFMARFVGFDTFVDADVVNGRADLGWATVPVGGPDGPARLVLLPGALVAVTHGATTATVRDAVFRGDGYDLAVVIGDRQMTAASSRHHRPGTDVSLELDASKVARIEPA